VKSAKLAAVAAGMAVVASALARVPGSPLAGASPSPSPASVHLARAGPQAPAALAATGWYQCNGNQTRQALVVEDKNGSWWPAITIPGSARLNTGGRAFGQSISCAPPGGCAVAGDFTDVNGHQRAMVADERTATCNGSDACDRSASAACELTVAK
jgi:hypothetical protein